MDYSLTKVRIKDDDVKILTEYFSQQVLIIFLIILAMNPAKFFLWN